MGKSRGRGPTLAKDINRKLVYRLIKQLRRTSRVEVARRLELNKNTVNSIVDEWIASGYVRLLGEQPTNTAGRKPILIGFHAGNKWAIGVQVTSTVIHWAVTDLCAEPVESFSIPLKDCTPDRVVAALAEGVDRLTAAYSPADCIGMCIGIPGLLDNGRSPVIRSSHLDWQDVQLLSLLQPHIPIPLMLDNSVKLASLGEQWHGSGQGLEHFVYCYFGNGIGCSLIVNGSIVRGDTNAAGELGHMVIDPQGPLCGCGNRGCLEAMVSLPALLGRMSAVIGKPGEVLSFEAVMTLLASGNEAVIREIEQTARLIGQALSCVTSLLNPKLIICDGPLMQASSSMFPIMEEELRKRCVSVTVRRVTLARSGLYPFASCIGAAAQVIQTWEEDLDSFDLTT